MRLSAKCKTLASAFLGTAFLCFPSSSAVSMPVDQPAPQILLAQNKAAVSDVEAVADYILPLMNDILLAMWDYLDEIGHGDPDTIISAGTQQMDTPGLSPQLKAKIAASVQKAKQQKQKGVTVDPDTYEKQCEAAERRLRPRLQQLTQQLYVGAKPRLIKLANSDPNAAYSFCNILLQFIEVTEDFIPQQTQSMYTNMYTDLQKQIVERIK